MGLKALIDQAGGKDKADTKPEKTTEAPAEGERKSNEVKVVAMDEEILTLVADFARAKAKEAKAKELLAELKERAIALNKKHGIDDFKGEQGTVQVISSIGPLNFNKKKALTFLTEEQAEECQKRGAGSTSVKFLPKK